MCVGKAEIVFQAAPERVLNSEGASMRRGTGKKKSFRLLSLLIAAILAISLLAGCGNAGGASSQENASTLQTITSDTGEAEQDSGPGEESTELVLYDDDYQQDDSYAEEGALSEQQENDSGGSREAEETQQDPAIDENGSYTSKEDVALYIHTYGKLPSNFITKKAAEKLGWTGGSLEPYAPGMCIGGNYFGNYEGLLPDGNYKECDIDTLGKKKRGAKRIIYSDDGRIYYTDDHYESFTQLY